MSVNACVNMTIVQFYWRSIESKCVALDNELVTGNMKYLLSCMTSAKHTVL